MFNEFTGQSGSFYRWSCQTAIAVLAVASGMGAEKPSGGSPPVVTESSAKRHDAANQEAHYASLDARRVLMQEWTQIMKNGGEPKQVEAWQQKNAANLAELRDQAVALAETRPPARMPEIKHVAPPADASDTKKEFLMERVRLLNERVRVHNETLQATPEERQTAMDEWTKRNASTLKQQAERARAMSAERPSAGMPRIPDSPMIPESASPELRDFLTRRHALMKSREETLARFRDAPPAEFGAAIEQWRVRNMKSFGELQEAAKKLSAKGR